MTHSRLGVLGGALIVTGTSIGAGMLALPVVTGTAGFFPSLAVIFASWVFMTATGLMFCELCVWLKQNANSITLAETTLGKWGKVVTWILYLFLFYCLTLAYAVGGGNFLSEIGMSENSTFTIFLFGLLFIPCAVIGKKITDPINRAFVFGMLASYIGLITIGAPYINKNLLIRADWKYAFTALPVAFTSFGFQGTVPTLASWMAYDKKNMRKAIVLGTTLTIATYFVWQWLFLGIVPQEGPHGLLDALNKGNDGVYSLQHFTQSVGMTVYARAFGFFALTTSFLGVSIGLIDFLSDGLALPKKGVQNTLIVTALAFVPPFFFAVAYPHIFLKALGLAGGFGCASLLGVMPIIMVWKAKYGQNAPLFEKEFLGKKWVLLSLLGFVLFEIYCEIGAIIS